MNRIESLLQDCRLKENYKNWVPMAEVLKDLKQLGVAAGYSNVKMSPTGRILSAGLREVTVVPKRLGGAFDIGNLPPWFYESPPLPVIDFRTQEKEIMLSMGIAIMEDGPWYMMIHLGRPELDKTWYLRTIDHGSWRSIYNGIGQTTRVVEHVDLLEEKKVYDVYVKPDKGIEHIQLIITIPPVPELFETINPEY